VLRSQDKVYFMDGSCRTAKVLEIAPDFITIVPLSESGEPYHNANEIISRNEVILIEYKSGLVEVYNIPQKTAVYNADGVMKKNLKKDPEDIAINNFVSINSLALCNADLSGFVEHLVQSKKIGLGCMAAYNFNSYVTIPNVFLRVLNNAKKNYDVGAFINFYPAHFRRRTTFYFGVLFKYTAFNFSSITEQKVGTSVNVTYTPSKGSQLATLIDVGTHTYLTKNFFFKTIMGIGGFNLHGDYKQQFNYMLNKDNKPSDPTVNYTFLPKIYVGLNLGFTF
jgi:hypothetical protein